MAITAAQVKELRERTGAGMMECKKALVESDGDMGAAIEAMRKSGQAKADKKAGRIAAEGVIVIKQTSDTKKGVIAEINCETDFVAKDESFSSFAEAVAERAVYSDANDVQTLMSMPLHEGEDTTIEDARQALIAKIGENMNVRRFVRTETSGNIATYLHGVKIGVMVETEGADNNLGRDIAMHIAASRPVCVNADEVPAELLAKEREIFEVQAKESGKPDNIVEKMVEGRIRKYLSEITLVGQPFVKDPEITIGDLLKKNNARVIGFTRLEVGEGIEKKKENFADEVMAQAAASQAV